MKAILKLGALAALAVSVSQMGCSDSPETSADDSVVAESKGSGSKSADATAAVVDLVDVGSEAPDFTLMDQDGKQVSLSDFKGKNVVLVFGRAHW